MNELINTFLDESTEHLETIEAGLLSLEKDNSSKSIINDIFQATHSIKGGAGIFGLEKLTDLSHVMEEFLSKVRNHQLILENKQIEILLKGSNLLRTMFSDLGSSEKIDIQSIKEQITQWLNPIIEDSPDDFLDISSLDMDQLLIDFSLNQKLLDERFKMGLEIYYIIVHGKQDLFNNSQDFPQYLSGLEQMGETLGTIPDMFAIHEMTKEEQQESSVQIIYSTAINTDLAEMSLAVPKSQFCNLKQNTTETKVTIKSKSGQNLEIQSSKDVSPSPVEVPAVTQKEDIIHSVPTTDNLCPSKPIQDKSRKQTPIDHSNVEDTLRVKVTQLNRLVALAGELVLARNQLLQITNHKLKSDPNVTSLVKSFSLIISDLQEQIMNTRMQPIGSVFKKFPRVVRDLGSQLDKTIDLKITGNEIELDKTIIEALSDPLTHLIRNVADHGLESPQERQAADKSSIGNLHLKAFHESGQVVLEVIDDGKGISAEKISKKAIEKGIVSQDIVDSMPKEEQIKLIFSPGFSTKEKVSSVSGRGVGMDVVKTNIEKIGGTVDLSSVLGQGTTVRMTLPLTLAIVSSLIIQVEHAKFIIPQVSIEELVTIDKNLQLDRIGVIQNNLVLKLRGQLLPLVSLNTVLGISDKKVELGAGNETLKIVVVKLGQQQLGLIVDKIIGIEEIVVKPISQYLNFNHLYSGASILGDGDVALIIDILAVAKQEKIPLSQADQTSPPEVRASNDLAKKDLLLFNNDSEEQFAIAVDSIKRIQNLENHMIQHVGSKEYVELENQTLSIIRLENFLPIQKPQNTEHEKNLLIFNNEGSKVCLVIHEIIDSLQVEFKLDKDISTPGILGSLLINKKLTLLLDEAKIYEMAN